MKITLTDVSVRAFEAPATGQLTVWDAASPVGLRVSQGGSKTFIVMLGSGRRHVIGRFGEVTLAQAREAARRLKAEKTLGRVFLPNVSFAEAKREYLAQAEHRPSTRDYTERNLNRIKVAKLGDITPRDINRILDGLRRGSRTQALRVYTAFFNWCLRQSYLDRSPCERMKAGEYRPRTRLLSDDEVQSIWQATEQLTAFHTIVRLLILTGQRRTEIASLQTSWLGNATITLPKEVCKNGREHTLPIGKSATSTLQAVLPLECREKSTLLFPARGRPNVPFNGWSQSKIALDKACGVQDWTLHDLRRYFASTHARIGTPIHVTERLLNHVSGSLGGIVAVYQRHDWMPEMKKAMEVYEAYLTAMLNAQVVEEAA